MQQAQARRELSIDRSEAIKVFGTQKALFREVHRRGPGLSQLLVFSNGTELMINATSGGVHHFLRAPGADISVAQEIQRAIKTLTHEEIRKLLKTDFASDSMN